MVESGRYEVGKCDFIRQLMRVENWLRFEDDGALSVMERIRQIRIGENAGRESLAAILAKDY
jgi:hypothetical protein